MIIWGSSSTRLKETYSVNVDCNLCHSNNFILHGIQPYDHIWFLPLSRKAKIFFLTCEKCSGTLQFDNLELLGEKFENMHFKTPKSTRFGWAIIGLIVVFIILNSYFIPASTNLNNHINYLIKKDVDEIAKNDFIILDSKKEMGYIVARVLYVNDGVYSLKFSKYIYKYKTSADRETKEGFSVFNDDFYANDNYNFTLQEIKEHFQIKEIITRKE